MIARWVNVVRVFWHASPIVRRQLIAFFLRGVADGLDPQPVPIELRLLRGRIGAEIGMGLPFTDDDLVEAVRRAVGP